MGALTPAITTSLISSGIGLIKNEISRQSNRADRNQALEQLQEKQRLQMRQAQENADLAREKIALDAKNAEEARKKALRRAVARKRASFGAQGIGSGAGSSQAVLLGMFEESDAEKAKREGLDKLRFKSIESDLSQRKSLNVLQREQLAEKQKLGRVSFGTNLASNFFG